MDAEPKKILVSTLSAEGFFVLMIVMREAVVQGNEEVPHHVNATVEALAQYLAKKHVTDNVEVIHRLGVQNLIDRGIMDPVDFDEMLEGKAPVSFSGDFDFDIAPAEIRNLVSVTQFSQPKQPPVAPTKTKISELSAHAAVVALDLAVQFNRSQGKDTVESRNVSYLARTATKRHLGLFPKMTKQETIQQGLDHLRDRGLTKLSPRTIGGEPVLIVDVTQFDFDGLPVELQTNTGKS